MFEVLEREDVKDIFNRFERKGYEIYIVGGAVRDSLLGEEVADIDFTTNATPDQIKDLFDLTIDVGKQFGTIQALLGNKSYEITTFRSENDYSDSRHPDDVQFSTSLEEDAKRRDFTINGMALDSKGQLYDFHNGQEDLKRGIVRTIGDPLERFEEDELRKWRLVRFASQKGFEIEKNTYESLVFDPDTNNVSLERIRDELVKIIMADKVNWGGYLLNRTRLYPLLLKRLGITVAERLEEIQDLTESFEIMYLMPKDISSRLAVLLIPLNEEERRIFLREMKFPKKQQRKVLSYLENLKYPRTITDLKSTMREIGVDNTYKFLEILSAIAKTEQDRIKTNQVINLRRMAKKILDDKEPIYIKDLAVNGNDLKQLGLEGKAISQALNKLLLHVYRNPEDNKRDILIETLKTDEEFNVSDNH